MAPTSQRRSLHPAPSAAAHCADGRLGKAQQARGPRPQPQRVFQELALLGGACGRRAGRAVGGQQLWARRAARNGALLRAARKPVQFKWARRTHLRG